MGEHAFCPQCGAAVKVGAKFCGSCGSAIDGNAAVSAVNGGAARSVKPVRVAERAEVKKATVASIVLAVVLFVVLTLNIVIRAEQSFIHAKFLTSVNEEAVKDIAKSSVAESAYYNFWDNDSTSFKKFVSDKKVRSEICGVISKYADAAGKAKWNYYISVTDARKFVNNVLPAYASATKEKVSSSLKESIDKYFDEYGDYYLEDYSIGDLQESLTGYPFYAPLEKVCAAFYAAASKLPLHATTVLVILLVFNIFMSNKKYARPSLKLTGISLAASSVALFIARAIAVACIEEPITDEIGETGFELVKTLINVTTNGYIWFIVIGCLVAACAFILPWNRRVGGESAAWVYASKGRIVINIALVAVAAVMFAMYGFKLLSIIGN